MDVKVFSRKDRLSKSDDELVEEAVHLKDLQKEYKSQLAQLKVEHREKLGALLLNEKLLQRLYTVVRQIFWFKKVLFLIKRLSNS